MNQSNIIIPFTINESAIKGRIIKLDDQLDIILKQHQYPEPIARILGELLMIVSMIGSQFKEEIIITMQIYTEGKIKYIVVDYESPNRIRGYAQIDKQADYSNLLYQDIIDQGTLAVTIDRKSSNNQRYQGIVELKNSSIAEAVEKYFQQSEQIETLIKLSIGRNTLTNQEENWCGGGIMLQKLPGNEDIWTDTQAYFLTIRDHELIDPSISAQHLLYSLYHELGVIVYDYLPIIHKCRCSNEKAQNILKSIGKNEAISLIVDGKISIICQFCNESQNFSKEELDRIYDI